MTNTEKLEAAIEHSGLKKKFIAQELEITTYGLQKKIKNNSEFKQTEISRLCKLLNIKTLKEKEEIFFAQAVDK